MSHESLEDLPIASREFADRPIGTEHEPFRTEAIESGIDVGSQIGGGPVRPIGFRDHSGKFAKDIRKRRRCAKVWQPVVESAILDMRFRQVIDDHWQAGQLASERGRVLQMLDVEQ